MDVSLGEPWFKTTDVALPTFGYQPTLISLSDSGAYFQIESLHGVEFFA